MPHTGGQRISSPIADASDNEMIRRHATGDTFAIGDITGNGALRDFAHADFVAAIADADGETIARSFEQKVSRMCDVRHVAAAHGVTAAVRSGANALNCDEDVERWVNAPKLGLVMGRIGLIGPTGQFNNWNFN